jgi:hypothetical protein
MTQKLVKCFVFDEDMRSRLTFSDPTKIRMLPPTLSHPKGRLELKGQSIHPGNAKTIYPLDTDLTVTVTPTDPAQLVQWLIFDVTPRPSLQPAGTSVEFRLTDGTTEYYWDAANWVAATLPAHFNDQATVTANIAQFTADVAGTKLGLVIKLATTDKYVTPTVEMIDLLFECRIDYLRSLIADALIPSLRAGLRMRIDHALRAPGGTKVRLQDVETAYNIVSVDAAYNHDDDPLHRTNLLSSADLTSKVLLLSTSVDRGKRLWIEFTAEPEVYLNFGSQDYVEVEKIPAVVIDSFELSGAEVSAEISARDIGTNEATVRRSPFRLALEFAVLLLAEKNRTLLAMMDRALEHASTNTVMSWPACDEQVTLRMIDEGDFSQRPNLSDKHQAGYTLRMENVYLWLRPEEVKPLVQQVNLTLTPEGTQPC